MSELQENSVKQEIISAISALNKEPEPIENSTGPYLVDKDKWAAHCEEHLNQALKNFEKLKKAYDKLSSMLRLLGLIRE